MPFRRLPTLRPTPKVTTLNSSKSLCWMASSSRRLALNFYMARVCPLHTHTDQYLSLSLYINPLGGGNKIIPLLCLSIQPVPPSFHHLLLRAIDSLLLRFRFSLFELRFFSLFFDNNETWEKRLSFRFFSSSRLFSLLSVTRRSCHSIDDILSSFFTPLSSISSVSGGVKYASVLPSGGYFVLISIFLLSICECRCDQRYRYGFNSHLSTS